MAHRNVIYLFLLTCSLYYVNCAGWKTTFSNSIQGNALSSTIWYVVESTDTIVAVQISDGKILWSFNITETDYCPTYKQSPALCTVQSNIKYDPKSGKLFAVAVSKDKVYLPRLSVLLAIDEQGKVSWTNQININSNSGGVTTTASNGMVYALASGYGMIVTAYDGPTGKILWKSADNTTLDAKCLVGYISWGLFSNEDTILFHCGPNMAAWDTNGNLRWIELFTGHSNFAGMLLAPKNTMRISNLPTTCSYDVETYEELWCNNLEGDLSAVSWKDGSLLTSEMVSWVDQVIGYTKISYDANGKYQWTFPVTVNYTGIVIVLPAPVYGEDDLWYWMTGQPGILYVFNPSNGKIVRQVNGVDPNLTPVYADNSGYFYGQGDNYITILNTHE